MWVEMWRDVGTWGQMGRDVARRRSSRLRGSTSALSSRSWSFLLDPAVVSCLIAQLVWTYVHLRTTLKAPVPISSPKVRSLKSIGRTPLCFSTAIKPSATVGSCLAAVCLEPLAQPRNWVASALHARDQSKLTALLGCSPRRTRRPRATACTLVAASSSTLPAMACGGYEPSVEPMSS